MLNSASSTGNILLVDGMNISERVEYSTLLSFWCCFGCVLFVYTLIGVDYFSHSLVVRFGVYFSHLEERVEYSSLCFDLL